MSDLALATNAQAVRDIVRCVVCGLFGLRDVSDDEAICSYDRDDAVATTTILAWRLQDALFVKLDTREIDAAMTVSDIAALATSRLPIDSGGVTPAHIFVLLRAAVRRLTDEEDCDVTWDASIRQLVEAACTKRWSLALADWGYGDLVDAMDKFKETESTFMDIVMRKGVKPLPVLDALERWDTASAAVHYLWRLRHSSSEKLIPRFRWQHKSERNDRDSMMRVESALTRLLAVMGIIHDIRIHRGILLDSLFSAADQRQGRNSEFAMPWPWLLDFELRATFGVNIHSRWQRLVFGNITRFGLPTRVRTFGDLCNQVSAALAI